MAEYIEREAAIAAITSDPPDAHYPHWYADKIKAIPAAEKRMIMDKCTGRRCPMQVGYKVDECNHEDCHYRTEPMTNAEKIRTMSDEELADLIIREISYCAPTGDCENTSNDCKACWLEWLKQPAEEGEL